MKHLRKPCVLEEAACTKAKEIMERPDQVRDTKMEAIGTMFKTNN